MRFFKKKISSMDSYDWHEYFYRSFNKSGKARTTESLFSALSKYPEETDQIHAGYFKAHLESVVVIEDLDFEDL